MITAVIVEDEAVASRRMQRLLESRKISVLTTLVSNSELAEYLKKTNQPDIFFMDIHLSDGVVFDLLAESQMDVPIIFTTAYDQYAIKAFKQNSIDYLLKPIDEDELDQAIAKYQKTKSKVDLSSIAALLSNQGTPPSYKERISVKVGDKIRTFNISDIHLFYSADKINYLLTPEGRAYPIDYSIEEIHKLLDPSQFFRVSRGYIVAIKAINDVVAYSNSRLKVKVKSTKEHEIIVARDRVKDFKAWLG